MTRLWTTIMVESYFKTDMFLERETLSRSWYCIEFLTGRQMWKTPGLGSLTYADGMVYLYDERGTMKLVKASADSFEKTGEFKVPSTGKGPYWAHPVVFAGRLYMRHNDEIFAYDISKKK